MDKGVPPSLFANDGSFMERFKQLQQEKKSDNVEDSRQTTNVSRSSTPNSSSVKIGVDVTNNNRRKPTTASSGGKLAFSLKQKSKLAVPSVKLSEDEEDVDSGNASDGVSAKRQRLNQPHISSVSSRKFDVAPPSPSDPAVKIAADRLASFVAKKGRQIEAITRQKNPGNTPFRFLFDEDCIEYKYYEFRIQEEKKALAPSKDLQTTPSGDMTASASSVHQKSSNVNLHTPATTLCEVHEASSIQTTSARSGESCSSVSGSDPIAMMEYYMKKAAAEERKRPPKQSQDEMPPPASLHVQASGKKGHHMGDYIPPEELENFLAKCNDAAVQKAAKEAADKAKIQADNVGHKLLSKMGWKEGEGLGSSRKGIADPISAGNVKKDHLGVGAQQPGEVTPDDDIYEQYKKRMMLGYRHRPNPLNNPRKSYY
ncbi:SURP and G-patch domain-containing protein 1-like protein isoform X2 [Amaranthus tricolor]|uniref:SURP and G-patch domain-containing protein 1-like protein isoform X2 n=1 Tax=Amaranthus tricolor TaxID=29722 RepID=UPI00258FE762|nr:SURP and G-patch domain-containing protein 1-like protein isoform X2 [Amaranthus tricolor]XP_057519772.1 SURP and G-patch domain-containing protein 1-like protein isoform X2 [Amaranthus tricolor]